MAHLSSCKLAVDATKRKWSQSRLQTVANLQKTLNWTLESPALFGQITLTAFRPGPGGTYRKYTLLNPNKDPLWNKLKKRTKL